MDRAARLLGIPVLVLSLVLVSCGRAPERPNLVLVTIDTVRADHLGCYGYFRNTTPNLDAFALRSIQFDQCYSPVAGTLPSHVSILSGTYPEEHGVDNVMRRVHVATWPTKLASYTEVLRDSGYVTAGFVSGAPLRRETGIDRGFSTYDDPLVAKRWATDTNEAVFAWLDTLRAGPYFLWVHYFDPHGPYAAPSTYLKLFEPDDRLDTLFAAANYLEEERDGGRPTAEIMTHYDAQLYLMDTEFGRLMERLDGRPDAGNTIIVVVGDHGQGLGQHGTFGHGSTWNEQLHVPLLVRAPGEAPRHVEKIVSTVDILPTLLALGDGLPGDPLPGGLSGEDVLSGAPRKDAGAFGQGKGGQIETSANPEAEKAYVLTMPRWKYFFYLQSAHEALYDREADPYELHDVAAANADTVRKLRGVLEERLRTMEERSRIYQSGEGDETADTPPELIDALRSLGYVE